MHSHFCCIIPCVMIANSNEEYLNCAVPASLLESLIQAREYSCPQCSTRQAIHLRPEQESALRLQARNILHQQFAAAAIKHGYPRPGHMAHQRPPPGMHGMPPRVSLPTFDMYHVLTFDCIRNASPPLISTGYYYMSTCRGL